MLLLTLLAFGLYVAALDAKGLAYDEAATALMSRATPPEILAFHWDAAFEHLPLWVLAMHLWSNLAGQSAWALRFIPAAAATLAVPLLGLLLRRFWPAGARWQTITLVLFVASPIALFYAQEARMYTLVVMLGIASVALCFGLLRRFTLAGLVGFVLVNWAMLGLQYYSGLLLVAQALFVLLLFFRLRPRILPWGPLLAGWALSVLPVLLWMFFAPGFRETLTVVVSTSSASSIPWTRFLADTWRDLSFGSIRWQPALAQAGYLLLPLALLGAGCALAAPSSYGADDATADSQWSLFAAIAVLLPLISGLLLPTLSSRYILYLWPFLVALLALGIEQLWRWWSPFGWLATCLAAAVALLGLGYYFDTYQKSEYREMAAFVRANADPNRDLALLEAPRQHLLYKFYLGDALPFDSVPEIQVPAYWPVTAPRVVPEDSDGHVQALLAAHPSIWLVLAGENEVDPGEFLPKYLSAVAWRQDCHGWLDVRLCHFISPHFVTPAVSVPLDLRFGGELHLSQVSLTPQEKPERTLLVQLDWEAVAKPTLDYKVSLRLLDAQGQLVAQNDDLPIGTLLPPTTWAAGDHKPGYMAVNVPPGTLPGDYDLELALYDAASGAPIPVDGAAAPAPVVLAHLTLGDTMAVLPADP